MERLMETSNAATWHHRGRFPDVIGVHVGMETDDHGGKKNCLINPLFTLQSLQ